MERGADEIQDAGGGCAHPCRILSLISAFRDHLRMPSDILVSSVRLGNKSDRFLIYSIRIIANKLRFFVAKDLATKLVKSSSGFKVYTASAVWQSSLFPRHSSKTEKLFLFMLNFVVVSHALNAFI